MVQDILNRKISSKFYLRFSIDKKNKMDSLPDFPRNAVHTDTEAPLTSVIQREQVNHAPLTVQ